MADPFAGEYRGAVRAAQISLPKLSDEELRQVCHALDAIFRERHQVVGDDEYGTLPGEDFATLAGEAWSVIVCYSRLSRRRRKKGFRPARQAPPWKDGCFNIQGLAGLPKSRFIRRIGLSNAGPMEEIEFFLRRGLGLSSGETAARCRDNEN